METGVCFACKHDLRKGTQKYVVVQFGGESRFFHPDCHKCFRCEKALRAGKKYTVVKATGLR